MKKYPKISIVIPSFNKGSFVKKTLDSIFEQNYPNLEVIIQDGGSTDNSLTIFKEYQKKYPKIIKLTSRPDKGQVDAINKGLKKSTGEIVAYLNADDIYKKGSFMRVAQAYLNDPDMLWITGYGDIVDEKDKKRSSYVTLYKNFLISKNNHIFLLMTNYITQPATFLTKKAFFKYGPFRGNKSYVMEYDLWLRLSKIQMPHVIKDYLASFRLYSENISSTAYQELLSFDNEIAQKYTKNIFIIFLHKLHNLGRVIIVKYGK